MFVFCHLAPKREDAIHKKTQTSALTNCQTNIFDTCVQSKINRYCSTNRPTWLNMSILPRNPQRYIDVFLTHFEPKYFQTSLLDLPNEILMEILKCLDHTSRIKMRLNQRLCSVYFMIKIRRFEIEVSN